MTPIDIVLATIALGCMVMNVVLLRMLRTAMENVRSIGTEALLASRANSAMDLAAASMNMKSFEDDRQQLVEERRKVTKKASQPEPSEPLLPDGTPLHILRPL